MRLTSSITLFAIALVAGGAEPGSMILVYLAAVTPELSVIDVREHRLPNRLVVPGYAVALCALGWQWWVDGAAPVTPLLAGAAYGGLLLVMHRAGGMGMGDVKLAGVLGLAAGFISMEAAVASPVIAFVVGGVAALVRLLRGNPRGSIPFGPFLLAGFWVAALLSRGASST